MARVAPKSSTIKRLFALSGNQCAFEGCKQELVNSDGTVIGEICHIEAAEEGGERFNKNSNDDFRRSFENLILLCPVHHKETNNVALFPKQSLVAMKSRHEILFKSKEYKPSDSEVSQAIDNFMQKNINSDSGTQINNQAGTQNIGKQIGIQTIHNHHIGSKKKELNIDGARNVISEFKDIIDSHVLKASPPSTGVIDYQNELIERIPRPVYLIETRFLRFRKDNGRIKAEVISYERMNGIVLKEKDDHTQQLLKGFLAANDTPQKEKLKNQLLHKGQQHPAIITCDGFLINGNRRKMALEELYNENNQDPRFEKMRVVILPENVTELDIRKIENRYQLQDEGKSVYHGLNKALTLRDNTVVGYSLKAQLRDDPNFAEVNSKELDKVVKQFQDEYLLPLERAEKYIEFFDKEDSYLSVEERWEAFKDYSKFYNGTLKNEKERIKHQISENEVGKIEDLVFKLIRKKDLRGISKLHMFLRPPNMRKYLNNPESKKFLFNIVENVDRDIPLDLKKDKNGKKLTESEIDRYWGQSNEEILIENLKEARKVIESQAESDKPLELINDALKKLNHKNLMVDNIDPKIYRKVIEKAKKISNKAEEIYSEVERAMND